MASIAIVCQYCPPEVAPIGKLMSELSADLSRRGHRVTYVTGYPNHPAGAIFPGFTPRLVGERLRHDDGYTIRRVWIAAIPSHSLIARAINYLSFLATALVETLRHRHDVYLIVSPPLTNLVMAVALHAAGRRVVLNIQDIYPDAAISTGIVRNRVAIYLLRCLEIRGYQSAAAVSVISSGFAANLHAKGVPIHHIHVLPNWVDPQEITPWDGAPPLATAWNLDDHWIALYSGTVGMVSGAEVCIEAMRLIADNEPGMTLLFVGDGRKCTALKELANCLSPQTVCFHAFQPRDLLPQVLGLASVGIVTLAPTHGGNSVPSKTLGYMAAGRPIIAVVDPDCDTWRLIQEADCGICVPAGSAHGLANALRWMRANPDQARRMGQRGRSYLLDHHSRDSVTHRYTDLICQLCSNQP